MLVMVLAINSGGVMLASAQSRTCTPSATQFCFSHDLYSSDTGYYQVAGYDSSGAPELEVEIGQTYVFDQSHGTNWYHPIGFAYYPDGAHNGNVEILDNSGCEDFCEGKAGATCEHCEPGQTRDTCPAACDDAGAVQYKIDDGWTGQSTDVGLASNTGTDVTIFVPGYEPEFFIPKAEWLQKHYTVELTLSPAVLARAIGGELFYFCHIHTRMSGRLRIVAPQGQFYQPIGRPPALYPPHAPEEFDTECGTYQAATYEGAPQCGGQEAMLCSPGDGGRFRRCLEAINCKMGTEMRVVADDAVGGTDPALALFMQQMIPHHANAVNMAKILMKEADDKLVQLPRSAGGIPWVAELKTMLYSIVNDQNYQIHQMEGYLTDMGSPRGTTTCDGPAARGVAPRLPVAGPEHASASAVPGGGGPRVFTMLHELFSAVDAGHYEVIAPDGARVGGGGAAAVAPTLILEVGATYTFDQSDHTNWFHPVGLGLGAELAPLSGRLEATVAYQIDGQAVERGHYERRFTYPKEQWMYHLYSISLDVTPELAAAAADAGGLRYACVLHQGLGLSGGLALGEPGSATPPPAPRTDEAARASFDVGCGTAGLAGFTPWGGRCDAAFMCGARGSAVALGSWLKQCFDAVDCKMATEMHVPVPVGEAPATTFMLQMIPHHFNAINMAKALLRHHEACRDEWDEVGIMLYSMINRQTAQIGFMQRWLGAAGEAPWTADDPARVCPDVAAGRHVEPTMPHARVHGTRGGDRDEHVGTPAPVFTSESSGASRPSLGARLGGPTVLLLVVHFLG
jgi:uncharacterized protein (DUF305 family)